jgi:hypothetical protein
MKKIVLLVAAAFALSGCGESSKTRFQIVNPEYVMSGVHLVIKIDTQTGDSWRLVGAPGTNFSWEKIPSN